MLIKLSEKLEKLFILFLYSQVFIDLITTIFVRFLDIHVSFGMIIRFSFIIFASIYIFINGNKKIKIFQIFLLLIFFIQFLYVFNLNSRISLFENLRYYLRALFFPVVALYSYVYFFLQKKDYMPIFKIINFNLIIIGLAYIFSFITNTYIPMYEDGRAGSSAWFLSGNEISSILCVLSFVPLYCFMKTNKLRYGLLIISIAIILLFMGTKTTFIVSIIITLLFTVILSFKMLKSKEKINIILFFCVFLLSLTFIFNQRLIPAMQNFHYMIENQKVKLYKESFSETGVIPFEIKEKRYIDKKSLDTNKYIASINFAFHDDDTIIITGYFYPMYFDLSHPKYVTKKILFESKNNKIEIDLTDTYNRFVNDLIFKEIGNNDYNGDFSGLEGYLNINDYEINMPYSISVEIEIDDIIKTYQFVDSIHISDNLENNAILIDNKFVWLNNKIIDNNKKLLIDIDNNLFFNKFSFLLGGRNQRLVDFLNNQKDYSTFNFLFGTGYIKNYIDSNGFEMDIPEIFITFGLVGFIGYFLVLFQLVIHVLKLKNNIIKTFFNFESLILIIMVAVIFGLSFMVGHMLLTPSSAVYVAILLNLTIKILMEAKNEKLS